MASKYSSPIVFKKTENMKLAPTLLVCFSLFLIATSMKPNVVLGADLIWDADLGNTGANDGSGTWNTSNTNWWDGSSNVSWTNSFSNIAVFGAGGFLTSGTRTVTVSGTVQAGGLRFEPVTISSDPASYSYVLSGGTIALADNAVIELVNGSSHTGSTQRIGLNSNVTGHDITIRKTGENGTRLGSIQLRNNKGWTGTLTLEDATINPSENLFVEVHSAGALNNLDRVSIGANSVMTINTTDEITVDFTLNSAVTRGAIRFDVNALLSGDLHLEGDSRLNTNSADVIATHTGEVTGTGKLILGTGAGTIHLNGTLSHTGGINVSGGKVYLGGNNSMTGNITISGGELIVNHEGALNSSQPLNILFEGTNSKILSLNGYSVAVKKFEVVTGGGSSNAVIRNGGAEDATLTFKDAGITFGGRLEDGDGGGVLNVQYDATSIGGRYALSGNNTYTGATIVTQGTLIARGNANALGAGTEVHVSSANNATLELDNGVTISGKHLVTSRLAGGNNNGGTWNGTVQAQTGGTNISFFTTAATNQLTVNGEVNGTDANGSLQDVNFNGAGTVTINGNIVNARRLMKDGSGMVILNGSNAFDSSSAGSNDFGLSVNNGTVRLGNENALYEGAGAYNDITFHSNNNEKRVQVYGVDVKVRTLFSGNTAFNSFVENGSDVDATLVLVSPGQHSNVNFGGVIRDGEGSGILGLKITGGGSQTLSGANTYTGDTTIAGGSTLVLNFGNNIPEPAPTDNILNHDVNASSLILQGGVLSILGKSDTDNSQRFAGVLADEGYSTIRAVAGSNGTVTVNLGKVDRQAGYLNFVFDPGTVEMVTTNASNTFLGTWATLNGSDLAAVDANGNIVAYTDYVDVTNFGSGVGAEGPISDDPLANVRIVDGGDSGNIQLGNKGASTPTNINSIIQSATGDAVIEMNDWQDDWDLEDMLRLGVDGLVMLAEGAGNLTIKAGDPGFGGILTAGGSDDDTNGTLTFANFSTTGKLITVNADILDNGSGSVRVVKNGPGDLVLASGANDYTGGTVINGGYIVIAYDRSLGAAPTSFEADNITMNGGGLRITAGINLNENRGITLLDSGGAFDVAENVTFKVNKMTGPGGFRKSGLGTLILDQANDYEGITRVSTGILRIEHNQALGSTNGYTQVGSGASLLLTNGMNIGGELLYIAGNGNNQGALRLQGGANAGASTSATWGGDIILSHTANTASRIGVDNFGTITITGVIKNGTSNILNISANGITDGTQNERGVVVLAAKNTYTGRTEITRGTLKIGVDDALPEVTTVQISIANSVTELMALDLNGYDQTIAGLSTGALHANANARVINSSSEKSVLTIKQNSDSTYEGSIRDNIELIKEGTGKLTLNSARAASSGDTNYSGKTEIRGGTLALSGSGDLVGTPWIQVDQGATFDVSGRTGGSYTMLNKTLSGRGTVSGDVRIDQHSTIRPGGNAVGASIADAGSGTGRLTFTGNLTLDPIVSGDLATERMVLQLFSSNSYISGSSVLADFGSVASDDLYDTVNVQGQLRANSGSSIMLDLASNHQVQAGQVFNLLDWGTVNWDYNGAGAFNAEQDLVLSAELASLLSDNGWILDISHFTSHGVVAIVPEPSRSVLWLLGMCGMWLFGTRRRPAAKN